MRSVPWRLWAVAAAALASGCSAETLARLLADAQAPGASPLPAPGSVPALLESTPAPSGSPIAELSASPTADPTAAVTPTPAPTASSTPTETPSPTPTASPTGTPAPTPTPDPAKPQPSDTSVPFLETRESAVEGRWYMCGFESDYVYVNATTATGDLTVTIDGKAVAEGGWFIAADGYSGGTYINFAYYPYYGNEWLKEFGSINYLVHPDSLWKKSDTPKGATYFTRNPVAGATRCIAPEP